MRFADCYWDIRISGNQGVGYQVIRESGCRLSGYQGIRVKVIRYQDIRLDIQQSVDREQASNHFSIDY